MTQLVFVGASGQAVYAAMMDSRGYWWSTASGQFEAFEAGHFSHYAVGLSEVGGTGVYSAPAPIGMPTGSSVVIYRRRVGASVSVSDLNLGGEAFRSGMPELDLVAAEVEELRSQVVGVAT